MFSLILKNMGHKSATRPLMLQTRNFKRDITPEDLSDSKEYYDKFEKFRNLVDKGNKKKEDMKKGYINGRDLYYPKYGNSIYDEEVQNGFKDKQKYDVEDQLWTNDKEKIYKDRED